MFGLSFTKLIVIAVIALFIVGPERMPAIAARLAEIVRTVRRLTDTAKERVREEMGPDFEEVDWQRLDPRQYDPRRIIRQAFLDEDADPQVVEARDTQTELTPESQASGASHTEKAS